MMDAGKIRRIWRGIARQLGYGRQPDWRRPTLRIGATGREGCERDNEPRSSDGQLVRHLLFDVSPYDGFDARAYAEDLQGWGSDHPSLTEAVRLLRPGRICEVGTWKGRSAINMANAVRALGLKTEIICVDTWLGSPEHWLRQEPGWYEHLRIQHGIPKIYEVFLSNVIKAGCTEIITPFPATSENAAVVFSTLGIKFDIVYVDAAHEYEPTKRDISMYYDLLVDEALLIGDDYGIFPGVTRAAEDFTRERGLRLVTTMGKFVIPKGKTYSQIRFAE